MAAVFLYLKAEVVSAWDYYSHMLLLLCKVPSHGQRFISPLEVVSWPIISLTFPWIVKESFNYVNTGSRGTVGHELS